MPFMTTAEGSGKKQGSVDSVGAWWFWSVHVVYMYRAEDFVYSPPGFTVIQSSSLQTFKMHAYGEEIE